MTLYPHEIVLRDINRYLIKSGALKTCLIALGWGMLIYSAMATSLLLLAVPANPTATNAMIVWASITCVIGIGLHMWLFEGRVSS